LVLTYSARKAALEARQRLRAPIRHVVSQEFLLGFEKRGNPDDRHHVADRMIARADWRAADEQRRLRERQQAGPLHG
jgi:hypothetical protein